MSEVLKWKTYPVNTFSDLKYIIVCSMFNGKYLLSRHKLRDTWKTQGGHIEPGETAIEAAQKELYEKSGIEKVYVYHVCDYSEYSSKGSENGAAFFADILEPGLTPKVKRPDSNCSTTFRQTKHTK